MIVRPVRSADLPALLELASSTGAGLTTLPANAERLQHRISWAERAFRGEAERADTAAALEAGRGQIRSAVGKQLGMKFTPSIAFVLDAVPETAAEIEAVLAKARGIDAEVAARAEGAAFAGEADPYKKPREDDEDAPAGDSDAGEQDA